MRRVRWTASDTGYARIIGEGMLSGMFKRMNNLDAAAKRLLILRVLISALAVIGLVVRLIWPSLKLDAVSLGLVFIAILPWLSELFESLELPGGYKFNFRDLPGAASAIPPPTNPPPSGTAEPSYLAISNLDPNLGLVGLRIEIERRLQALATST